MTGIEKITQRILQDAQAEIDEVLSQANAEAATITSRFEAQAQREYDELVRRGAENAREREENLSGAAFLEARKDTLSAKQSMIDSAFTLAGEKLATLPVDDYIGLLVSLAVDASYSGEELLLLSAEDAKTHGAAVVDATNKRLAQQGKKAGIRLAEDTRPTGGGLLLRDGKVETNCTFETLLRLRRNEISAEVAAILFD